MLSAKKSRVAAPAPELCGVPGAAAALVPASGGEASSQATTVPGMQDTQLVATPARSAAGVPQLVPQFY